MRPGPKGLSPAQKRQHGETRPSRSVVELYPNAQSGSDDFAPPSWLNALGKKIWREKVDRYRRRGQQIDGFQHALAQYVALEAKIIELRKKGRRRSDGDGDGLPDVGCGILRYARKPEGAGRRAAGSGQSVSADQGEKVKFDG